MFTSFDEKTFRQAIENKDYLRLKINTVSAIRNDPTFDRGETKRVLKILEEQVPEIFEEEVRLDFEEQLDRNDWDKDYFTKLTYWLQENFAKSRIDYIKKVGSVVHKETEEKYKRSLTLKENDLVISDSKKVKKESGHKRENSKNSLIAAEEKNGNFSSTGVILAVGALVLVIVLLIVLL